MKGQQQILSSVMLVGIFMGLIFSVYQWGLPMIEKNRGIIYLNRAEVLSKEIANKIVSVTLSQGRDSVNFNIPGKLVFVPSASDFVTSAPHGQIVMAMRVKGTQYATNIPIYMTNNMLGLTRRDVGDVNPVLAFLVVRGTESYYHVYNITTTPLNYTNECVFINLTGERFVIGENSELNLEYQDTVVGFADESYPAYCSGRPLKVVNVRVYG